MPENDENTTAETPTPDATPAAETLPDDEASPIVEQPDDAPVDPEPEATPDPEDPPEQTGNGDPAEPVSGIEAAAEAAAEADPDPEPEPEPDPEPEAPADPDAEPAAAKGAAATVPTKVKPRKRDKTSATIQAHLSQLRENRTLNKPAEPTEAETAANNAQAEKRARLDEILLELAELDEAKAALVAEQESLVATHAVEDTRTFHEKLKASQAASRETNRKAHMDRVAKLDRNAHKSPIDQRLGDRPRNRPDIEANPQTPPA